MKDDSTLQSLSLEPIPKVVQTPEGLSIKIRVLTPFRLLLMEKFVMEPLAAIWGLFTAFFILNLGLIKLEWGNLFAYLPFTQESFIIVMVSLLIVWLIERFSGYPLNKLIFGKNIHIKINDDDVIVWRGLWRSKFPRHRIAFVHGGFRSPATAIYRHSDHFGVIIDGTRRIKLAEIFGEKTARAIVNNANVALRSPTGQTARDIDPTRRSMA
jgi:hypothetical protein